MRRVALIALLVAAPLALAGCHDEQRLRERLEGPPTRLPVEPNQPKSPPAPALLDTVQPYEAPKLFGPLVTRNWQLVVSSVTDDADVTYRVPDSWSITPDSGKSENARGTLTAAARATQLNDSDISLATYAAQLADGNPLFQYPTSDGSIVYVTRREIKLAATEPNAPSQVFHTAVVSVDGRIVKLDVRYDATLDWRFDDLATGIVGTLQVQRDA